MENLENIFFKYSKRQKLRLQFVEQKFSASQFVFILPFDYENIKNNYVKVMFLRQMAFKYVTEHVRVSFLEPTELRLNRFNSASDKSIFGSQVQSKPEM